jgi:molybdate transport system ATP-binding protein
MKITGSFCVTKGSFTLNVTFDIPCDGMTVIVGHSGAGKTTLLRCIAGLERAQKSRLLFNDRVWEESEKNIYLPTCKRPIGYVFQRIALFPHLSVLKNLRYGYDRTPVKKRRLSWDRVIQWLGVAPLLTRDVAGLSGGERQRVAIARSLLTSPDILLLDEPISSLDKPAKKAILHCLERLRTENAIPMLYVTHAFEEVAHLADDVLLMDKGRLRAVDAAQASL